MDAASFGQMGPVALAATAFGIGLSGAVMPGPVLAVTITHAARQGFKAGPLIVLGHALLEAALIVALVAGLGPFLTNTTVSGVIAGAGALILVWMGAGMLRSLSGLRLDLETGAVTAAGPVRDGVLLSLANPYWVVWWATVGLGMIAMAMDSGLGWWGLLIFWLGHISSDLVWYSFVSAVVSKGRRYITDSVYRVVVGVCAVFLVGIAVYFGIFAWDKLTPA
jgi:threonine/homoserine/homoserine lactone efflux protein